MQNAHQISQPIRTELARSRKRNPVLCAVCIRWSVSDCRRPVGVLSEVESTNAQVPIFFKRPMIKRYNFGAQVPLCILQNELFEHYC